MNKMMEGKVVVVTGSGRGIGRDMALQMAAEGAAVVVNDLGVSVDGSESGETPAAEVVREIESRGGRAVANYESVSDWVAAGRIVQCAMDTFGRIDVVVNNAGILRDRFFFNMSVDEWRAVIDVHLHGSFFVSRAAAPYFKSQSSGAYVHMTSTSGLIGNMGQANYAAAKLGVAALSKSIALDMRRYNVRSNCISPFAWSRMIGAIPTDTPAQQARVEKLKKMESGKIAPMAVFLASDAAKDVSGQIFAVRANEIFLMSQPRPIRSVHRSEGWTPQTIAEQALPAFKSSFFPLEISGEVFSWDPI
ncbi:SDR family NAD(P)-dependent oxidoreductase [Nevskia sp.]|uniref:SDR family NAD(P)-dependent oxidoreductase n=1 Tax=Nevskia sp. TaxID=1929292 RepID=UPI0025EF14D8|nr:SDR family NAD(P)-dependent oxidoreductase [Nevskia sp.]